LKESSDGETLMAVGIWFQIGEQQMRKHDVLCLWSSWFVAVTVGSWSNPSQNVAPH